MASTAAILHSKIQQHDLDKPQICSKSLHYSQKLGKLCLKAKKYNLSKYYTENMLCCNNAVPSEMFIISERHQNLKLSSHISAVLFDVLP